MENENNLTNQTESSEQKPEVKEKKKVVKPIVEDPKFRLNVYKNGMVRSDISKNLFREMSAKHGDVMRAISSNNWQTMDEIVDAYWEMERRLKFEMGRTRKKIESAVAELVEVTLVTIRM
jgi:hypothetical protein